MQTISLTTRQAYLFTVLLAHLPGDTVVDAGVFGSHKQSVDLFANFREEFRFLDGDWKDSLIAKVAAAEAQVTA